MLMPWPAGLVTLNRLQGIGANTSPSIRGLIEVPEPGEPDHRPQEATPPSTSD